MCVKQGNLVEVSNLSKRALFEVPDKMTNFSV
jgi:hypothetical protein